MKLKKLCSAWRMSLRSPPPNMALNTTSTGSSRTESVHRLSSSSAFLVFGFPRLLRLRNLPASLAPNATSSDSSRMESPRLFLLVLFSSSSSSFWVDQSSGTLTWYLSSRVESRSLFTRTRGNHHVNTHVTRLRAISLYLTNRK